jgi:hypothetical protein
MAKPKTLEALVRAGGPDEFVREALRRAARLERQNLLEALERQPVPTDPQMASLYAAYVRDLRPKLDVGQAPTVVREQTRQRVERLRALGDWGEEKAVFVLKRAGFKNVTDMNTELAPSVRRHLRGAGRYALFDWGQNPKQISGEWTLKSHLQCKEARR